MVVATEEFQKPLLENLYTEALSGLSEIIKISKEELAEIEPHVKSVAAINVPYTGIIDYVAVAKKYGEKIEEYGGRSLNQGQQNCRDRRHF